ELVDSADLAFAQHRSTLQCPSCKQVGTLQRHSRTYNKNNVCLRSYRCSAKDCGRTHQSTAFYNIIAPYLQHDELDSLPAAPTPDLHQITSDLHRLSQKVEQHDRLAEQVTILTNELNAAKQEIARLQAENASLKKGVTGNVPPVSNNIPPSSHPWSQIDPTVSDFDSQFPSLQSRRSGPPALSQPLSNSARLRRQEATARSFQEASENQGFQHLFIPTRARIPLGQLRAKLRRLNINNSRVLNIHYPARNIVALLVHNDYAPELRQRFEQFKIPLRDKFDPCDPNVVSDPQHAAKTTQERTDIAHRLHCDRMVRALQYIRLPVRYAVARYFFREHWIDETVLQKVLASRTNDVVDLFSDGDADKMSLTSDDNMDSNVSI
ncbi:hypothetical protein BD560DRAFT_323874, partial [Blakeslea trispora]